VSAVDLLIKLILVKIPDPAVVERVNRNEVTLIVLVALPIMVKTSVGLAAGTRATKAAAYVGFCPSVVTGTELWSDAITTGILLAIVVCPKAAGIPASIDARLLLPVVWSEDVAAPVGSGRVAADITQGLVPCVVVTVPSTVIVFPPS
jgi:hypothetical protein